MHPLAHQMIDQGMDADFVREVLDPPLGPATIRITLTWEDHHADADSVSAVVGVEDARYNDIRHAVRAACREALDRLLIARIVER